MAVMYLQQSALRDHVNLDDLIEFIETRKNTFWGKFFKGGKDKKEIKKKGVFGIPLEILVERNGADSTLGASAAHLRVPSFIDDVISAMKQMDLSVEASSARTATSVDSRSFPKRSIATARRSTCSTTTRCSWQRCSRSSCESFRIR